MAETTIPILPCPDLRPVLDFYTALGFEVTHHQTSPNPYAVVRYGGIELHFFGVKQHDPATSYSTCYVRTDDVDGLHEAFRRGLKEAYGKVPTRGLPRFGAVRDTSHGVRQFLMTDPGGNCVRIGTVTSDDQSHRPAPKETFARALHYASLFADSKGDAAGAARVIDRALRTEGERPTAVQLLRLLVLRADVAGRLGDEAAREEALAGAAAVELTAEERESFRDDLARLGELRG
ncbi:VOC family protein [Streptomyces mobaraensis NBRC 13819 = DSM 40847]|uniref:bleomycin resistance protein n=1 Tax=Streptomyces mobaraensis TaxID=35621 RepID=UPI0005939B76|nr:VOC family protein [Streptomyces mobaraensis]QTT73043.1 VOC family protein [Streptomyces mobaraensis NBRC 13819 = DSM 40847]